MNDDLISRAAAIDAAIKADMENNSNVLSEKRARVIDRHISAVPSAQPEPSIPISWIEEQIDWLKSMDNEFSNITAMNISTLVKKWRKENGKDEGSD